MSSRIPISLQAVFLNSNRGNDVYLAPPEKNGNRVFLRSWRRAETTSTSQEKIKNLASSSSKKQQPVVTYAAAMTRGRSVRSLFGHSHDKIKQLEKCKKPVVVVVGKSAPLAVPSSSKRNVHGAEKLTIRPPSPPRSPPPAVKIESPQEHLDQMLRDRGYSTDTYKTLQTAYFNKPSSYQQSCYGAKMSDLIRQGDVKGFRGMMLGGMSPNPCNVYGESLVHMVCRRGNVDLLKVLIAAGVNLQVSDDYGRTVLHDACWAANPAFDVVDLILKTDNRLFYMMDRRGALPLSYVHKDHWSAYIKFLEETKDLYFPILQEPQGPPELTKYGPNSRPLPNPDHALPDNVAAMVASGRLTIIEANMMMEADDDEDEDGASVDSTADESDDDDDDDDDEDSDEDDEDSDDDSCSDSDEDDELFDILQITQARFVA